MNQRHRECALWALCRVFGKDYEEISNQFIRERGYSWGEANWWFGLEQIQEEFCKRVFGVSIPACHLKPTGGAPLPKRGIISITLSDGFHVWRHALAIDDGVIIDPCDEHQYKSFEEYKAAKSIEGKVAVLDGTWEQGLEGKKGE